MEQAANRNVSIKLPTWAKLSLGLGLLMVVVSPLIFTIHAVSSRLDFTSTGEIGDTIGGLTSPFVGLIGSLLVYLALKAQIDANKLLQEQLQDERTKDKLRDQTEEVNQLYNNLRTSIDQFSYASLDPTEFTGEDRLCGSEAIYKLFQDFYCDCHLDEEELKSNPKITELISIMEICDALLTKLLESNIPTKAVMETLTKHQFRYRIFPKISDIDKLEKHYCESCSKDHGLPLRLIELIQRLKGAALTES